MIWSYFSCLLFTGQVWSWGDGDYGKLGRGGSDGCKTPKLVEKLQDLDIVKVCCGSQFSVALTKDGQVYTWGKGDNQRLGHGTDEHVRYPKLLDSLQGSDLSFVFNHCVFTKYFRFLKAWRKCQHDNFFFLYTCSWSYWKPFLIVKCLIHILFQRGKKCLFFCSLSSKYSSVVIVN